MKTILKWPGGKEKELPVIRENIPDYSGRYAEPFVGGGAVYFDTDNRQCCINDKSAELINLYTCTKERDPDLITCLQSEYDEFKGLESITDDHSDDILCLYHSEISIGDFLKKYDHVFLNIASDHHEIFVNELKRNLSGRISRSHKLEAKHGALSDPDRIDNMEAALKSAYYIYLRHLYNDREQFSCGRRAALFFFIREFCYSSMFRYNKNGEFNVPYGGISYNRKDFQKKIDYLLSPGINKKLSNTRICNMDFEEFINSLDLTNEDFMFIDPPYDSDFSTYSGNAFGKEEQIRLRDCLKRTKAGIMLVIKNTDFIYELYKDDFNIKSFDKKYLVSFKNRNEKQVKHLVITNY
ncbi:MAG: DNA adenine methylase [Lachnospiraceae bacterium]|nr:DNA adenine methylase [Lachnospiraceae bacterium]